MQRARLFAVCGPEKQVFRYDIKLNKATLCGMALEMVHQEGLQGQPEDDYAKIVFLCMVCAIMIGVPSASSWVTIFAKVPLGLPLTSASSPLPS